MGNSAACECAGEGQSAGFVPEKRHCSMIKPASAGFLLCKNINLNISMVLAKSAAEGLNISCNRHTVYLYSIHVRC